MRRRLTVSLVAMVVATLVAAGVVLVVVETHAARARTRADLRREASGLVAALRTEVASHPSADPARRLRTVLQTLARPLSLADEEVIALLPDGSVARAATPRLAARLPAGVTLARLDPAALLAGRSVAGNDGALVYAAVPFEALLAVGAGREDATLVIVVTRRAPSGLAGAGLVLALTAAAIVAVAVAVAERLGRRITAPLRDAEAVTGRIAAGDLGPGVPEPPGTDPEMSSLIASINAMAAALGRSQGSERDFLLSVSHELRTPLTSIRGYAEAITDGAVDDAGAAARVILGEAARLERLVGDLLELARLRAAGFGLRHERVDLAEVAGAVLGAFAMAAADAGVALTGPSRAPVVAVADPDRVAQIVANLVENALRYARRGVAVGVAADGAGTVVWVDDDGPGVAPEVLGRLFERLFSVGDGRGGRGGSGLGLAIVAELATAMGGRAVAHSPLGPDGGTRLAVHLPGAGSSATPA